MSISIIIQARMTSQRLPGKVLRPLCGVPMLGHLLTSVCRCGLPVIVATSVEKSDDPLAEFCQQMDVLCVRGPLDDVAARFALAAEQSRSKAFVRISGDSPLLDHRLISRAVELYQQQNVDIVTNLLPRVFPKGQSVEVVGVEAFRKARVKMYLPRHLEHVTSYFYDHAQDFRIVSFQSGEPALDMQMSVDTQEDFCRAEAMINGLDKPLWQYTWKELADRMVGLMEVESC